MIGCGVMANKKQMQCDEGLKIVFREDLKGFLQGHSSLEETLKSAVALWSCCGGLL